MGIWSKLIGRRSGEFGVAMLLWPLIWSVAAAYIAPTRSAGFVCMAVAFAPFAIGLLVLWLSLVACIGTIEHGALALVFGVPFLLWLCGPLVGLEVAVASIAWWALSRPLLRWLHKRTLAR